MNYFIELQRNNLTPAKFFSEIRFALKQKGIDFYLDLNDFINVTKSASTSTRYYVVENKDGTFTKKCSYSEYRTYTDLRRKVATYQTSEGYDRVYLTDELEQYEKTELHNWKQDWVLDADEKPPAKSEIYTSFPCEYQCYILNWDGSCFNEICEFTYDDDNAVTDIITQ